MYIYINFLLLYINTHNDNRYNKKDIFDTDLPYYGGLKGLTINTHLKTSKQGALGSTRDNFYTNFNKIQLAAAQLVAIQEAAKQKGSFNEEDDKYYADSLLELGIAAQKLADLQHTRNVSILDYVNNNYNQIIKETPAIESDYLSVNAPRKEASVAESKPIGIETSTIKLGIYNNIFFLYLSGLSIAGVGGLASAKPNAVAIAGQDGLSVAAPKGIILNLFHI